MYSRLFRRYRKAAAEIHAPDQARALLGDFDQRCRHLLANRTRETDRALEKHQSAMILPGIALYEAYRNQGLSEPDALASMERFYEVLFRGTAASYRIMGRLPGFWRMLGIMVPWSMAFTFPESGWKRQWRENSGRRIAFDMQTCFYQTKLRQYSREHLLGLFCQCDDVVYRNMSKKVGWERTTTLARGGTVCDFCFSRSRVDKKGGAS